MELSNRKQASSDDENAVERRISSRRKNDQDWWNSTKARKKSRRQYGMAAANSRKPQNQERLYQTARTKSGRKKLRLTQECPQQDLSPAISSNSLFPDQDSLSSLTPYHIGLRRQKLTRCRGFTDDKETRRLSDSPPVSTVDIPIRRRRRTCQPTTEDLIALQSTGCSNVSVASTSQSNRAHDEVVGNDIQAQLNPNDQNKQTRSPHGKQSDTPQAAMGTRMSKVPAFEMSTSTKNLINSLRKAHGGGPRSLSSSVATNDLVEIVRSSLPTEPEERATASASPIYQDPPPCVSTSGGRPPPPLGKTEQIVEKSAQTLSSSNALTPICGSRSIQLNLGPESGTEKPGISRSHSVQTPTHLPIVSVCKTTPSFAPNVALCYQAISSQPIKRQSRTSTRTLRPQVSSSTEGNSETPVFVERFEQQNKGIDAKSFLDPILPVHENTEPLPLVCKKPSKATTLGKDAHQGLKLGLAETCFRTPKRPPGLTARVSQVFEDGSDDYFNDGPAETSGGCLVGLSNTDEPLEQSPEVSDVTVPSGVSSSAPLPVTTAVQESESSNPFQSARSPSPRPSLKPDSPESDRWAKRCATWPLKSQSIESSRSASDVLSFCLTETAEVDSSSAASTNTVQGAMGFMEKSRVMDETSVLRITPSQSQTISQQLIARQRKRARDVEWRLVGQTLKVAPTRNCPAKKQRHGVLRQPSEELELVEKYPKLPSQFQVEYSLSEVQDSITKMTIPVDSLVVREKSFSKDGLPRENIFLLWTWKVPDTRDDRRNAVTTCENCRPVHKSNLKTGETDLPFLAIDPSVAKVQADIVKKFVEQASAGTSFEDFLHSFGLELVEDDFRRLDIREGNDAARIEAAPTRREAMVGPEEETKHTGGFSGIESSSDGISVGQQDRDANLAKTLASSQLRSPSKATNDSCTLQSARERSFATAPQLDDAMSLDHSEEERLSCQTTTSASASPKQLVVIPVSATEPDASLSEEPKETLEVDPSDKVDDDAIADSICLLQNQGSNCVPLHEASNSPTQKDFATAKHPVHYMKAPKRMARKKLRFRHGLSSLVSMILLAHFRCFEWSPPVVSLHPKPCSHLRLELQLNERLDAEQDAQDMHEKEWPIETKPWWDEKADKRGLHRRPSQ